MWNMSTDLLGGTNKEVRLPALSAGPIQLSARLFSVQTGDASAVDQSPAL